MGAVGSGVGSPGSRDQRLRELVGPRLHRLRRMRRLTLQEVAADVGMSHSFLSMLERGLADVSVGRLDRLAEFYGIRLSELLLEEEGPTRPRLVSPEDMLAVDRGSGITYRFLPAIGSQHGLQIIHVIFAPRSGFKDVLAHQGDDICWVLRGDVTLLYGGDEFPVRAGQCVSYAATVPHAFRNDSERDAELLGISTPPYW